MIDSLERVDTITISTGLVELRRIETAEEVASQNVLKSECGLPSSGTTDTFGPASIESPPNLLDSIFKNVTIYFQSR